MNITFSVTPDQSSFPVMIINGLESSPFPRLPGQTYRIQFTPRPTDIAKGRLDISGLIKSKANAPVKITIQGFNHGPFRPPIEVVVEGTVSNRQSFIFMDAIQLPKGNGGLQGRRMGT